MSELMRFKSKVRLVVLAMVMLGVTGTAHAEGAVSATGKGVAGGVLVGAELPTRGGSVGRMECFRLGFI